MHQHPLVSSLISTVTNHYLEVWAVRLNRVVPNLWVRITTKGHKINLSCRDMINRWKAEKIISATQINNLNGCFTSSGLILRGQKGIDVIVSPPHHSW